MKQVIQKLIAQAGLCSRREAEKFITNGSVKVNGKLAKLGDRADEDDVVTVNGQPLRFTKEHIYIKLHKPAGVVCTTRSFPGERNVFSIVRVKAQLSIVGRLDKESEGLVFLTNDGDLAYRLTHPKFGVDKVYVVTLQNDLDPKDKRKITEAFIKGLDIGQGDGRVKAKRMKHLRGRTFEVVLEEGKKRQVRRMFRVLNCHVAKLSRVRIGTLTIGGIKKGEWKYLNKQEITRLRSIGASAR